MCHRASRRGFSLHSLALSLCQPEGCGLEQEELGNISSCLCLPHWDFVFQQGKIVTAMNSAREGKGLSLLKLIHFISERRKYPSCLWKVV